MHWILILVGGGLIFLCLQNLQIRSRALAVAKASERWPVATGKVLSVSISEGSYVSTETRQTVHTYLPAIRYTYNVGNHDWEASRIAFGQILYYQPAEVEAFKAAHPVEAKLPVYYNPANPAEAVLDRDQSHVTKLALADFAMLVLGLCIGGLGAAKFFVR